eukprot:TRINITY_DN3703_c4_g1_i1.p2 TRINITY_DN3703_c4_g1~~TRINITY_DN3703_c4_g1_i1.p2  ORF type:complete len:445 (+),score=92.99 TRINITY_DN3703_c4_g1_i1:64-1398(+)
MHGAHAIIGTRSPAAAWMSRRPDWRRGDEWATVSPAAAGATAAVLGPQPPLQEAALVRRSGTETGAAVGSAALQAELAARRRRHSAQARRCALPVCAAAASVAAVAAVCGQRLGLKSPRRFGSYPYAAEQRPSATAAPQGLRDLLRAASPERRAAAAAAAAAAAEAAMGRAAVRGGAEQWSPRRKHSRDCSPPPPLDSPRREPYTAGPPAPPLPPAPTPTPAERAASRAAAALRTPTPADADRGACSPGARAAQRRPRRASLLSPATPRMPRPPPQSPPVPPPPPGHTAWTVPSPPDPTEDRMAALERRLQAVAEALTSPPRLLQPPAARAEQPPEAPSLPSPRRSPRRSPLFGGQVLPSRAHSPPPPPRGRPPSRHSSPPRPVGAPPPSRQQSPPPPGFARCSSPWRRGSPPLPAQGREWLLQWEREAPQQLGHWPFTVQAQP